MKKDIQIVCEKNKLYNKYLKYLSLSLYKTHLLFGKHEYTDFISYSKNEYRNYSIF